MKCTYCSKPAVVKENLILTCAICWKRHKYVFFKRELNRSNHGYRQTNTYHPKEIN
jgi:hypothetical protein